jgi:choline dehydrogenase-like flavoprotein
VGGSDADFLRGYEVELGISSRVGGWRRSLRGGGSRADGRFWMRAFGEVLPSFENRVTLEHGRTDAWGIPIVRIECAYGENEEKMAADQARSMREMVEAAGWRVESHSDRLAAPGLSVHEMGTARMGTDPESSVLDPHNQCWEVPNLFVTDGACFPSGGHQNPTLTMMALTARACERIAGRMAAGDL